MTGKIDVIILVTTTSSSDIIFFQELGVRTVVSFLGRACSNFDSL